MIYILSGEDTQSSYNRLQQLLNNFSDFEKIKLDEKAEKDEYITAFFAQSLINTKKVIVCTNFLTSKKINKTDFKAIPDVIPVIFWENKKVNVLSYAGTKAKVISEEFKPPPTIFYFLDSISPQTKLSIAKLNKLAEEEMQGLMWQLTNRFYLMILAKLNTPLKDVISLNRNSIYDWQWKKIALQATKIDLIILKKIFHGLIKIDFLIKSGKTDLAQKILIRTLFLKYLPSLNLLQ